MNKKFIALPVIGAFALVLSGCSTETEKEVSVTPVAAPQIEKEIPQTIVNSAINSPDHTHL